MSNLTAFNNQLDNFICYLEKLFPINRSITGDGNRQTLFLLKELLDLNHQALNLSYKLKS